MNMKKRFFALTLVLALLLALAGCAAVSPDGQTGDKSFTLKVVHADGGEFETNVSTDKETLGEALQDAQLIDGENGPYGLFVTTVDKETADPDKEEWWCLTKGGESVNTGVDSTPVEDGATYELTLTTGY